MSITADDESVPPEGATANSVRVREPWLNESVVAVRAPALVISALDGQIVPRIVRGRRSFSTAHGYYDQDRRILSRSELTVDGEHPEWLEHRLVGATQSLHESAVRTPADPTPDPVVFVERLHRAKLGEVIVVRNDGGVARTLDVRLRVAADLADVSDVRRGDPGNCSAMKVAAQSVRWEAENGAVSVHLEADPAPGEVNALAPATVGEPESAELCWRPTLPAGEEWAVKVTIGADLGHSARHPLVSASDRAPWTVPKTPGDHDLDRLLRQSLSDLQALLLAPAGKPRNVFASAGAPWYLTLFGRDSLWTARLLLPIDEAGELAFGTLRTLDDLRGRETNRDTDEEPGKILHELRCRATRHQEGQVLPPVYYGSMDATPLFVLLLAETYEKTGDQDETRKLIPGATASLEWLRKRSEADPLGFIRYQALNSGALFNHGWKDSADAIVAKNGVPAAGPVALSEVQAYSIGAARGLAMLLREVIRDDAAYKEADELCAWADKLQSRFLKHFRVLEPQEPGRECARKPYFAIALDKDNTRVDGLSSNIGHLLGAGILSPKDSAALAQNLISDELYSGWGLRTRGSDHRGFNGQSYHGGAVWAHDTAIAIRGLVRATAEAVSADDLPSARVCRTAARKLADGLLSAASAFEYRLPELFSGRERKPDDRSPLPFASACRPQAWSAAAGVAIWDALKQLDEKDGELGSS